MENGNHQKQLMLLYAEDDPEDQMLMKEALEQAGITDQLKIVEDGESLINYLYNKGNYYDSYANPSPDLILLDLNLPKKDGRKVLKEIKQDPELKKIPVIAMTTSCDGDDIQNTYVFGANSYIKKPVGFQSLVEVMRSLKDFWSIVELPDHKNISS